MKTYIAHLKKRVKEGMLLEVLREVKWVCRYSWRYRRTVIIYICLGILGTGMSLGIGIVSKYIIDAVTGYDSGALAPAAVGYASS